MPTDAVTAAAAPRSFKVKGVEYYITPLSDAGWAEYTAWIQDHYIAVTKRNLDGLKDTERQVLLDRAFDTASRLTMHSPEANGITQSIQGMFRLVWMHLRPRHPDITTQQVAEILNDRERLAEVTEKMRRTMVSKLKKKAGAKVQKGRPRMRRKKPRA